MGMALFKHLWRSKTGALLRKTIAFFAVIWFYCSVYYYSVSPPYLPLFDHTHTGDDNLSDSEQMYTQKYETVVSAIFFVMANMVGKAPYARFHMTFSSRIAVICSVFMTFLGLTIPISIMGQALENLVREGRDDQEKLGAIGDSDEVAKKKSLSALLQKQKGVFHWMGSDKSNGGKRCWHFVKSWSWCGVLVFISTGNYLIWNHYMGETLYPSGQDKIATRFQTAIKRGELNLSKKNGDEYKAKIASMRDRAPDPRAPSWAEESYLTPRSLRLFLTPKYKTTVYTQVIPEDQLPLLPRKDLETLAEIPQGPGKFDSVVAKTGKNLEVWDPKTQKLKSTTQDRDGGLTLYQNMTYEPITDFTIDGTKPQIRFHFWYDFKPVVLGCLSLELVCTVFFLLEYFAGLTANLSRPRNYSSTRLIIDGGGSSESTDGSTEPTSRDALLNNSRAGGTGFVSSRSRYNSDGNGRGSILILFWEFVGAFMWEIVAHSLSLHGLIDLLAFVPSSIMFCVMGQNFYAKNNWDVTLDIYQTLWAFSIIRILKFEKDMKAFSMIATVARDYFFIFEFFGVISLAFIVICASLVELSELRNPSKRLREHVANLPGSLWLCLLIWAGDFPEMQINLTPCGRVVLIFVALFGGVVFSVSTGIFASAFQDYLAEKRFYHENRHKIKVEFYDAPSSSGDDGPGGSAATGSSVALRREGMHDARAPEPPQTEGRTLNKTKIRESDHNVEPSPTLNPQTFQKPSEKTASALSVNDAQKNPATVSIQRSPHYFSSAKEQLNNVDAHVTYHHVEATLVSSSDRRDREIHPLHPLNIESTHNMMPPLAGATDLVQNRRVTGSNAEKTELIKHPLQHKASKIYDEEEAAADSGKEELVKAVDAHEMEIEQTLSKSGIVKMMGGSKKMALKKLRHLYRAEEERYFEYFPRPKKNLKSPGWWYKILYTPTDELGSFIRIRSSRFPWRIMLVVSVIGSVLILAYLTTHHFEALRARVNLDQSIAEIMRTVGGGKIKEGCEKEYLHQ